MRYFEDFHVGDVFELGSRSLTQEQIIAFAREYDPQPFHTDPEAAKHSAFGTLVASGWQTVGVYMSLMVKSFLNDVASMGSPGVDSIKWLKPVKPGDRLHARMTIVEHTASKSRPDRGIVKSMSEMRNQDGDLVMTLQGVSFIGRRPTASA